MARVKLYACDQWFSKCIRERTNWTCEKCGTHYPEAAANGAYQGLDCSHYYGRGSWAVRFHPDNAFCHCTSCHFSLGGNPEIFRAWAETILGEGRIQILTELRNDTSIGKLAKKSKTEISKHYREEFRRMRELRADGVTGRIEFENWV